MSMVSNLFVTLSLKRTVSEINGDFSQKIANFSHPHVFNAPLKGFPLEFGTGAGVEKTGMMVLPDVENF